MAGDLVLVTDTTGDVKHARECGVRAVGVAWGMHREKDLLEAGAEFVAVWPQELVSQLLPVGSKRACGVPAAPTCGRADVASARCGCADAELTEAGAVRRTRALKRAEVLASRLGSTRGASALSRRDAALLRSLARLRTTAPAPPSS